MNAHNAQACLYVHAYTQYTLYTHILSIPVRVLIVYEMLFTIQVKYPSMGWSIVMTACLGGPSPLSIAEAVILELFKRTVPPLKVTVVELSNA